MISRWRLLHTVFNRISENSNLEFPLRNLIVLTPRIVQWTLSNCSSDVNALRFFLWCACQRNYFHDPHSFDRMIPVVSRLTNQFESVKGVVKELESFGCFQKPQTFLVLLRIYWRGRMYGSALEAFEEMCNCGYTPNTFARNMVMDVLFKIGRVDEALVFFRNTRDRNFLTFNFAICNLYKMNKLSSIEDVFRAMVREGFRPNVGTFSMVLNCFCKAGRLAESLQILGLMITLGIPPSVTIWSILIDGFSKVGQLGTANQLLEKMIESGHSPTVVTYTSLIKGYMGSRMFGRAIDILNIMESKGCVPDLVLCNVLIDCLSKAGRYDDALDFFLALPEINLEPDSYTLCSILSTICWSQRFSLLEPRLVSGLVASADLVLCNCLMNYFCKSPFPSHAIDLYNAMLDRGFTPDGFSYVGLLSGLCRAGKIDEAINVYNGLVMNNTVLDAHVHTVVISELIKVGKFHRAIRLFRKAVVAKFPLDVVSYTDAIHGLFKGGRIDEAHSLFCQVKEVGLVPNIYTYNVMLSGFCRARKSKRIKRLLRDLVYAGIELDCVTFNTLIGFLLKSDRIHSAHHLLIEMLNLGLKPNKTTYAILVDRLSQAGEVGDANHPLLKGHVEHNFFIDNTNSDDLPYVAASALEGVTDVLSMAWRSTIGARDPVTSALQIVLGRSVCLDMAQVVRWKTTSSSKDAPSVRYAASFAGYRWMGPKRYDYAGTKVFLRHRSYEAEVAYLEVKTEKIESPPKKALLDSGNRPLWRSWVPSKKPEREICRKNCHICNESLRSNHMSTHTPTVTHQTNFEDSKRLRSKGRFLSIGGAVISCRNERAPDGLVADAHLVDGFLDLILIKDCPRAFYLCLQKRVAIP